MAKALDLLVAELASLRAEIATLKVATPSPSKTPRRSTGSFRRVVGDYFKNPSGIMAFQNQLLDWNTEGFLLQDGSRVHFDDRHLCQILDAEYETQDCWAIKPSLLAVIRRLHNEGKHGGSDRVPTTPSVEFPVDLVVAPLPDPDARRD